MKTSAFIHIIIATLSLSVSAGNRRPRTTMNNMIYGDGTISGNSIVSGGLPIEPIIPVGGELGVLGYEESMLPIGGPAILSPILGPDGLPCPPPIIEPIIPVGRGYGGGVLPYVEPILPVVGGYGGEPIIDVLPYVEPLIEPIMPVGGGYGGSPILDVLPYVPPFVEPIMPVGGGYGGAMDVLPFNDVIPEPILPIPTGGYGGGFGGGMDVLPFNDVMPPPFVEPVVPLLKHRCRPRYSEPVVPFQGPMGF
jgi:hypothetical protein